MQFTELKLVQIQVSWNAHCGHWVLSATSFTLQSHSYCTTQRRYGPNARWVRNCWFLKVQSCNRTQRACRRGEHSHGKWYPIQFSFISFLKSRNTLGKIPKIKLLWASSLQLRRMGCFRGKIRLRSHIWTCGWENGPVHIQIHMNLSFIACWSQRAGKKPKEFVRGVNGISLV